MDRKEFIESVFAFFNVKDEEKNLFRAYDLALSSGKNIDWNKLYMKTLKEATSRYLPPPKFFIEKFFDCRKPNINFDKFDGNPIRIFLKNGRFIDFVACSSGLSLDQIKAKAPKNDNVVEVRMYPKQVKVDDETVEVVLMGESVYPAGTPYEVIFARA